MSDLETMRSNAIDTLTERYARNELPMEEYERLVSDIQNAADSQSLAIVADIVAGPKGSGSTRPQALATGSVRRETIEPRANDSGGEAYLDQGNVQSSVAILSERRYRGDWLQKSNIAAVSMLASQVFDFRDTNLPAGTTTLEAFALLGSIEIIVPPTMAVRMEAAPIAGEATLGRGVNTVEKPNEPLLIITGSAILGSIIVKAK